MTSAPLSDATQAAVLKQVEFYFSDSNAPRDKFLLSQIEADPEGWVDLALVCSFSRMAALLGLGRGRAAADAPPPPDSVQTSGGKAVPLSTLSAVADALRASTAVVVDEAGRRVRRSNPLRPAAEVAAEADGRSLYATPFPHDASLDGLVSFFEAAAAAAFEKSAGAPPPPHVASVRMRRHLASKDFKGSVFVEFASEAAAAALLAAAPSADAAADPATTVSSYPAWLVHDGAPVRLEAKAAFVSRKLADRKAKAEAAAAAAAAGGGGDAAAAAPTPATPATAEAGGTPAAGDVTYEPNKVVSFTLAADAPGTASLSYGEVKAAFGGRNAGVLFVEYEDGAGAGAVRFRTADDAAAAVAKAEAEGDGLQLAGGRAAVSLLSGEAEQQYYARVNAARVRSEAAGGGVKRPRDGGGRGGGRGRGRGGRGFGGRGGGGKRARV